LVLFSSAPLRIASIALLTLAAALAAACGQPSPPAEWVAVAGGDTIRVGDVGRAWDRLDDRARAAFAEREDPARELLRTMIRKSLIGAAVDEAGYLDKPFFVALGQAWTRMEMSSAAQRLLESEELARVTESELADLRERMGDTVWVTDLSGRVPAVSRPFHLLDMPYGKQQQIEAMAPGDTAIGEMGNPFRLDSISRGLPEETAAAPSAYPDSVLAASIAMYRRSRAYREMTRNMYDDHSVAIDTSALLGFHRASPEIGRGSVVESDLRDWDRLDMSAELALASSRFPFEAGEPGSMLFLVENMLAQSILSRRLLETAPETAESIRSAAAPFLEAAAAESIYRDSVLSVCVPDSSDVIRTWEMVGDTLEVPQRRALALLWFPEEGHAARFAEARERGELESVVPRMPAVRHLSAEGQPDWLTRPLRREELPPVLADTVFSVAPGDTLRWHGPLAAGEGGGFAFRLRRVFPRGPAGPGAGWPELKEMTRDRLLAERLDRWMADLRDRHGASVNEELVDSLPTDPELWR
jgi:hypothetical protein